MPRVSTQRDRVLPGAKGRGGVSAGAGLDPRVTPARGDIAAARLRGRVEAERFVEGRIMRVTAPVAALRETSDEAARRASELRFGERFEMFDEAGGRCWGQALRDGYVGWVERGDLDSVVFEPDHIVVSRTTLLLPEPDIKAPHDAILSLGSLVKVAEPSGDFVRITGGGWLFAKHLAPLPAGPGDYVAVAERLLEAPYVWGGCSAFGLDCSGLVQLALALVGRPCPRDSDMQMAALGRPVAIEAFEADQRRGDLVFFPGHVAIVTAPGRVVHANGFEMRVAIHDLGEVAARSERDSGRGIVAVRRPGG